MPENYLPNLAFQPYIAPQQALPVEEFNALGQTLNKRYDENIAKWDELDAYANQVQLSDADKGIKDSVLSDTRNILKTIREKGNWENSKLQVREVAKRLANDQALSMAQQNFKRLQEQKETENKMAMQGHTLIDFAQGRFNQSTIDPVTGKARVLDFSGAEKLQDYDARRKSIFEGVTPDGYDSSSSSPSIDKATGMIYQIGSGSGAKYVSAKKIKEIAKNNLDNYLQSEQGQQELRKHMTVNSMNSQPMDLVTAKKQILADLINTGMTRVFQQTSKSSSTSITSLGGAAGGGAGAGDSYDQGESLPINVAQANPLYGSLADKLQLKKRSDISTNGGMGVPGNFGGAVRPTTRTEVYGNFTKQERIGMDNIAVAIGIKKKGNDYSKEDMAKLQQYAAKHQETATAPKYKAFTDTEIAKNNSYVANGNMKSRGYFDIEKNSFVEFTNLPSEVKEALNGKKAGEIQFAGVISPDNHFYDLAKKSKRETNNDGWLRPQYITIAGKSYAVTSPSSETSKSDIGLVRAVNQISSANRYGVPVRMKGPDNKSYVTYPNGQYSRDGQPLYTIKDMNGNVVQTLPLNNVAGTVLQGMKIEE